MTLLNWQFLLEGIEKITRELKEDFLEMESKQDSAAISEIFGYKITHTLSLLKL